MHAYTRCSRATDDAWKVRSIDGGTAEPPSGGRLCVSLPTLGVQSEAAPAPTPLIDEEPESPLPILGEFIGRLEQRKALHEKLESVQVRTFASLKARH